MASKKFLDIKSFYETYFFQLDEILIRNLALKTFVIKVNAIKLSTFRCRLDTIIEIKVEDNGRG